MSRVALSLAFVRGVALWTAGAIAFAVLATFAAFYDRFPGDEPTADGLQDAGVPVLGGFFDFINTLGDGGFFIPFVLILAVACLARRAWLEALLVVLVFVPRNFNDALKGWIERPRPSAGLVEVTDSAASYSFPSGHTVSTAVLFGLVFFLLPALVPWRGPRWLLQAACLLAVAAAGPARVYVGVHWPSDVLGGYLLALLFLAPAIALYRLLRPGSARS
jgi:undecaprenyl-diphosphatase